MNTVALFPLFVRECTAEILKAARQPAFAVPTLVLPIVFYALFGIALARPGAGNAGYLLATYGVFAALGPSLFGFGAGLAAEREGGTLALKQISPLPGWAFLGAKLVTCLLFTLVVLLALYSVAAFAGGVALERGQWAQLLLVHLASVLPFCLLGMCVGLSFGSSGAMAVTNVLFMGLAVIGGLWIPVFLMPKLMQAVAGFMPSFHLAEMALSATGREIREAGRVGLAHVAPVAAFTVVVAALAFKRWQKA
jgi:ABC-2 type transport system permease protein